MLHTLNIKQKEFVVNCLMCNVLIYRFEGHKPKPEAHRPRFAHSGIATADMQMLCIIFPILSSQLMKISSFEQFLVLKKNIWA